MKRGRKCLKMTRQMRRTDGRREREEKLCVNNLRGVRKKRRRGRATCCSSITLRTPDQRL